MGLASCSPAVHCGYIYVKPRDLLQSLEAVDVGYAIVGPQWLWLEGAAVALELGFKSGEERRRLS